MKKEELLGKELLKEFDTLRREACFLIDTFRTFEDLFAAGPEVDKILGKSANEFFVDINRIMLEYICLVVCRITDPPGTGKRTNLTIPRMNKLLRERGLLSPEIKARSDRLMCYRELVQDARNKIVAHMDLNTYIKDLSLGIYPKEEKAKNFFEVNLPRYLDAVANAIGGDPVGGLGRIGGDAQSLRGTLKRGLIADKLPKDPRVGPKLAYDLLVANPPEI